MSETHTPPYVCPFCSPSPERVFFENALVRCLWDAFPVAPGHALVIPKRHVAGWFETTKEEKLALIDAIDLAKQEIERRHHVDGYNIGVNSGEAAGQTIFHVHAHVIPRALGDVEDPRGGVRHVIPSKGNYLAGVQDSESTYSLQLLVTGGDDPLLPRLNEHIQRATHVDIAVAFTLTSGIDLLWPRLEEVLLRQGKVRILTGDYLDCTDPDALLRLLDLEVEYGDAVELRMFETTRATTDTVQMPKSFHPKTYIFLNDDGGGTAFVGSSNLSSAALQTGIEWNYRVVSSRDRHGFADITRGFEALFMRPETTRLTADWVRQYRARRSIRPLLPRSVVPVDLEPELPKPPPEPHALQLEALAALKQAREKGAKAGLVVLATGLGKTWLSAFDSVDFGRVLFVAHRDEILKQALNTFRRVRLHDALGYFTGETKDQDAAVLFASVQTLSRRSNLTQFPADHFSYLVIDEFHHASAATYRRLIQHFKPSFLLGLTATPERSDGADLLDLCGGNLVFRRDLTEGIRHNLLCPFTYYGVPDEVDYSNIPWRSRRFDEERLTEAVATQSRAQNALEQLRTRGGKRTIAFCVSQRHADFMKRYFRNNGVRAAAVHAGPTSDPRTESLDSLRAGQLDVVCAVDMFNEGVDLPELDTVLMLRPTESRILWLQQFGRGLRKTSADKRLKVIDYIGNHRTFLLKPQTLFSLPPGDAAIQNLLAKIEARTLELPPGCEVTYDLEAIDILRGLLRVSRNDMEALRTYVKDFMDLHDVRPSALEAYRDGYNPRAVRAQHGSWFQFLESCDALDESEKGAWREANSFLAAVEATPMEKSFKMVVLLAMIDAGKFPGQIHVNELAAQVRQSLSRHPTRVTEFGDSLSDDARLVRNLTQNPIAAWVGGRGTGGISYFKYQNGVFSSSISTSTDFSAAVSNMTRELAEWRLAQYEDRSISETNEYLLKIIRSGPRPILMLPDRKSNPGLPSGWTPILIQGTRYNANFVKIAVNVIQKEGSGENVLPTILQQYFGIDAGAPGTRHQMRLVRNRESWELIAG